MTNLDSMDMQQLQGCGDYLRSMREKAGLSQQDAATRLKTPLRILQALEAEQWQQLGAPVFVRGQLRSYARLLGADISEYLHQAHLEVVRPAELVSHSYTSGLDRFLESFKRRAVYVVLTAVLVIPVWMGARSQLGSADTQTTASLDVVPATASAEVATGPAPASQPPARRAPATPYVASMVPISRADAPALSFHFNGDSWVQISAPDGSRVEQALMKAGDERNYAKGEVGNVVLGNATAVEVQQAGSTVDTTPYQRGSVARFTVSSDGSLAPISN
ncbi:helix-turn-helix domain-containing protein [Pseudoxanthomonas dokdonensis]|uniref:Membrane protein n=1 Tax=Pseudoxanthomonas dokdonensis TaxID=344882 RepID=A0A0R0CM67_9GAMM|nr:RodZ domain-containing protein [Pseudoxanthomonas dokdonensis]KRG71129.1 membrane protein [Pseudoxanthomonas dokdonensis]